jgi:hypothetical protein
MVNITGLGVMTVIIVYSTRQGEVSLDFFVKEHYLLSCDLVVDEAIFSFIRNSVNLKNQPVINEGLWCQMVLIVRSTEEKEKQKAKTNFF